MCPGSAATARPSCRSRRRPRSPWGRAPARIGGMRALTVVPGQAGSARLDDVDDPPDSDGPVLVETLAIGVCGTDAEIIGGAYGWAPPGRERLVLGHESVGRVLEAPPGAEVAKGDLVVGIVRRPDPVPCGACAAGEWDMCRNGRYSERGIKERHGYGSERFRIEPDFAVKIDPALKQLGVLVEPASILAKAWEHITRIGRRTQEWRPRTLLVTGAGPIGLLAAIMGAQRGFDAHVFDRNETGTKPDLVRELGGTYHDGTVVAAVEHLAPDIVIECTGAPSLIRDLLGHTAASGIVCLTGVSNPGRTFEVDVGQLNRTLVLNNHVIFGTVNANRRHYELAEAALLHTDPKWLGRLITRRVPLEQWQEALEARSEDIKVIV